MRNNTQSNPSVFSAAVAGIVAVSSVTKGINDIVQNTSGWDWFGIIPFGICFIAVAALFFLNHKYHFFAKGGENNPGSRDVAEAVTKTKADVIRGWFDEYIAKEGVEYMNHFGEKQQLMIKQMHDSLDALKENGVDIDNELESGLYYFYIFALLRGAKTRVWAVSMGKGSEWNDSCDEKEFLRLNFEVAGRRIQFERIFVIEKKDIQKFLNIEPVKKQIEERGTYYKTYIAFKEDLDAKEPDLYQQLGCGFLAFDDFAIADDRFIQNEIRGFIYTKEANYKDFNRKFTELRDFARPLDKDFVTKIKKPVSKPPK